MAGKRGRPKKNFTETDIDNIETFKCPICGKIFKKTPDTYCWVGGEKKYTLELVCSWECFKVSVDKKLAEKKEKELLKNESK